MTETKQRDTQKDAGSHHEGRSGNFSITGFRSALHKEKRAALAFDNPISPLQLVYGWRQVVCLREASRFPTETVIHFERGTPLSTSTSGLSSASAANWKDEINARLAAHRTRRTRVPETQASLPGLDLTPEASGGRRNVAARVAERYAKAPSYQELLAAQAAAARAAEAAAEAAAQAHAVTQAALAGMEEREEASGQDHVETAASHPQMALAEVTDPLEEVAITPPQPLPAKLIEFPRELIAPRKARPRLAEGPLREADPNPEGPQLRIFEVEPESISKEPAVEPVLPEWHSIRLDPEPQENRQASETAAPVNYDHLFDLPLQVASLEDRLMAGIVDLALVMAAFFVFVLVFVACTAHPPTGKPAIAGAGVALATLFVLYQWLFFAYSDATPGMRYAKIALCTFDDENPTRRMMRNRVGALLLSVLPMGLGFLWCFFDEDRLGWHDRMTRTYQRSYR